MLRFIPTISQSAGLFAVISMVCTSVAVANPISITPATSTIAAAASKPAGTTDSIVQDSGVAQGGPLSDVPQGHWAYEAVSQLVKDGLILGYPDGLFKGSRPMTRYEAALLTYRALDQIEAQIAAGKTVNQADIDAAKKLMDEFARELKDVEAHVAALQQTVETHSKQLSEIKAEADATQLRVNQAKLGFNLLARPGTSSFTLNGINAAGAPLAAGTSVAFGTGINNSAKIGTLNTGIDYDLFRVLLGGQLDPRWAFGVRISDNIKYSPFDATSVSPSYCTGSSAYTVAANCAYTLLNFGATPPQNTLPLNLDYAYAQYSSPGGITSQIGRYSVGAYGKFGNVPNGTEIFSGQQISGANLGYSDPHGHLYAAFYFGQQSVNQATLLANGVNSNAGAGNLTCTQGVYGLNATSPGKGIVGQGAFTAINPYCTAKQMEEGGWMVYYFSGPRIALGAATDNQQGRQYTFYNPNEVTCTVAAGPTKGAYQAVSPALCAANFPTATISAPSNYYLNGQSDAQLVEGFFSVYFGPKRIPTWNIRGAYATHPGINPFTGNRFVGNDAENVAITYASKGNLFAGGGYTNPFVVGGGRRGSNVLEIDLGRYGINSAGQIFNALFSGATAPDNNIGLPDANGLTQLGFQATHWLSDSVRLGFNALHVQQVGGLQGTSGIPIATGGYINQINENQLNAEMYLYFF